MSHTVGEMAKKLNVAPSTLRYYDKEGLLPFVARSKGGMRSFTDKDYEWLMIIDCLKKTGMPIKDIKVFIDWAVEGDATIEPRLELLEVQRRAVEERIAQLQDMLAIIRYKCWYYETARAAGTTAVPRAMKAEELPKDIRACKKKYDRLRDGVK